jgi:hypothetical protein
MYGNAEFWGGYCYNYKDKKTFVEIACRCKDCVHRNSDTEICMNDGFWRADIDFCNYAIKRKENSQ